MLSTESSSGAPITTSGEARVSLEELKTRQIQKLFGHLNLAQKREFLTAFINTFDQHALRNMYGSLESLRHYDFSIQVGKPPPTILKRAPTKLPSLVVGARKTSIRRASSDLSVKPKPNKIKSIDAFIKEKNKKIIDDKWSLVDQAFESDRRHVVNSTKTDHVIDRLKAFFRDSFENFSLHDNRHKKVLNRPKINPKGIQKQNIDSINDELPVLTEQAPRRGSKRGSLVNKELIAGQMYLKKLKNNYYDRKLWTSLNSSRLTEPNYLVENSARDYSTDLNILTSTSKAKSIKSKNVGIKSSYLPIKLEDLTLSEQTNGVSKFQRLVLAKSCDERTLSLIKILEFMPHINTMPTERKLNLLYLLIGQESHEVLEAFQEIVKATTTKISANINYLPDHILLRIFSYLDDSTLDVCPLVCRQWYYLTSTSEIWLYKCRRLGEREGLLRNIEQVLVDELHHWEEIDWRLAYLEVKEFIDKFKQRYWTNYKEYTVLKSFKRFKIQPAKKERKLGEYDNFYASKDELAEDKDEEDEYDVSKTVKKKISDYDSDSEDTVSIRKMRHEQEKELKAKAADYKEVKTDLSTAKDLLNKVAPNVRLRWKMPDESDISLRPNETVLYSLKPIQKVKHLMENSNSVVCMDYDKKRFVTGGLDRIIYIYDLKEAQHLGKLEGHRGGIRCVRLFANKLCSGSWDMTIMIWNMLTFEPITTVASIFSESVSCLYFNHDYLISGSHDRTLTVLSFTEFFKENFGEKMSKNLLKTQVVKLERQFCHHQCAITSLSFDAPSRIISSDIQGNILITSIKGELLAKLVHSVYIEPITSIKLVGALLIASTSRGKVMFWNKRTQNCESILVCHPGAAINSLSYFNERFYTGGSDGMIMEWDLYSMSCLRHLKGHNGPVNDLMAFEDKIISCGKDNKVIYWNMGGKKLNKSQ